MKTATRSPARPRAVSKGEQTREAILVHALGLATRIGFEGLTIGRLADDLKMSKSGLFAHFRSKEALQLEILRMAGARMVETVVKPALATPRGEPRVRMLFDGWLQWEQSPSLPGGCPFMAASFELDDRPGPVRDFVVQNLRDWMDTMAGAARIAVQEGHFRADLDCEQFAHECQGIGLAFVHASRLMRDPKARVRAQTAFDSLLDASRASASLSSAAASSGRRR
ncbi:MAG: TetR/AcrR family transcriptional regulator [Candidatus Rokuibacteriota bacterium]|jgi:AcrR family transcriptional regulator|nr:TetR/AcrR family transcriptional regulator [Patescibacteria group bacterium]